MKLDVLSQRPRCEPERHSPDTALKAAFVAHPFCSLFLAFCLGLKGPKQRFSPSPSSPIVGRSPLPLQLSALLLLRRAEKGFVGKERRKVFQVEVWQASVSSSGCRHAAPSQLFFPRNSRATSSACRTLNSSRTTSSACRTLNSSRTPFALWTVHYRANKYHSWKTQRMNMCIWEEVGRAKAVTSSARTGGCGG